MFLSLGKIIQNKLRIIDLSEQIVNKSDLVVGLVNNPPCVCRLGPHVAAHLSTLQIPHVSVCLSGAGHGLLRLQG